MQSEAFVRGYGGAMGGGKSRCLCEVVFLEMLRHPGLQAVVFRQAHTSIVRTTKRTMLTEVVPPPLIEHKKESAGEDYIRLRNGSVCHFAGLDDPYRWYSAELGLIAFDEAQEISEQAVLRLATRLRQMLKRAGLDGGEEFYPAPQKILMAFNPANPGHWLQAWFIKGAAPTGVGYAKDRLYVSDADEPIGDCEFVFARAKENVHLGDRYLKQLKGLPKRVRQRYLEGEWLFIDGSCFFDEDALSEMRKELQEPVLVGVTEGGLGREKARFRRSASGKWCVWKAPVRAGLDEETDRELPAHRYIVSVDVSSGGAADYSAIQVVDIDSFEQVAEWQDKLDPDLVAVEAFRAACVYNDALIVPETAGGWGISIIRELERLRSLWRRKVSIYTQRSYDRLAKRWTDKLGYDMTMRTRPVTLDTLERLIREREFRVYGERTWLELCAFVRPLKRAYDAGAADSLGKPQAQPGTNDDLTMALAIAVTVAVFDRPRAQTRVRPMAHRPAFVKTGY